MRQPDERNTLTRRHFIAAIAGGAASFAGHALGAHKMFGKPLQPHGIITDADYPPRFTLPQRKETVPLALHIMMGAEKSAIFEQDLARVAMEYEVTQARLRSFLDGRTNDISKAASMVGRYFASPMEELCYISASLFVSGWIHGIDPYLMHAIAHVESGFSNNQRSWAGAMGCMQVTINSAIFELHSMNTWRFAAEWKLRKSLRKLGGIEFHGLSEEPKIERRNGRLRLSKEDDEILMARPLPNAVWGARTLLLKYKGGRMRPADWEAERKKVIRLLQRYKGLDEKAEYYANNAYHYYKNVYCRLNTEKDA